MQKPKVIVLLPVYRKDSPDYLRLAVDSILAQTYQPLQILIGIDGPIDGQLAETVQSYATNEQVTLLPFELNYEDEVIHILLFVSFQFQL